MRIGLNEISDRIEMSIDQVENTKRIGMILKTESVERRVERLYTRNQISENG